MKLSNKCKCGHLNVTEGSIRWTCALCGDILRQDVWLSDEGKTIHEIESDRTCSDCGKSFQGPLTKSRCWNCWKLADTKGRKA